MTAASSNALILTWTSPDRRLLETVRLVRSDRGLRATGYIVSAGNFGATYSILVDTEGNARRFTVRTDSSHGERSLSLTRSDGGPWLAGEATGSSPMPALSEANDIFLDGSAFTASLPIRRLGLHKATGTQSGPMVQVTLPTLAVAATEHTVTTTEANADGAVLQYSGRMGDRELRVDADGFLIESAGLSFRLD